MPKDVYRDLQEEQLNAKLPAATGELADMLRERLMFLKQEVARDLAEAAALGRRRAALLNGAESYGKEAQAIMLLLGRSGNEAFKEVKSWQP